LMLSILSSIPDAILRLRLQRERQILNFFDLLATEIVECCLPISYAISHGNLNRESLRSELITAKIIASYRSSVR